MDGREAELAHPNQIEDELRRVGWCDSDVRFAVARYRQRFNEHGLGYSALLVTTGVAALAAATAGHLLVAGVDGPVDRDGLADWLTILVCSIPFAAWAHVWAARVDRDDPVAAWSRPRQILARLLLWATGIVGIAHLVLYAAYVIGLVVGATWAAGTSLEAGAANVAITVCVALPLGLWTFAFLHRFDDDDPAAPAPRRYRAAG
jgi:hypothetical protein